MTKEEMDRLRPGDMIRHKHGSEGALVTANYGGRVTAVRTYDVTNPDEWDLVVERMIAPSASAG